MSEGLRKGINIDISEEDIESNLSINSGIEIGGDMYWKGAFIPKNTFRSLSREELDIVMEPNLNPVCYGNKIKIISLPSEIAILFSCIGIQNVSSYDELKALTKHKLFENIKEKLTVFFKSRAVKDGFHNLGIQLEKGNEYTTTLFENKYIGLHIDSWDNEPIEQRNNSKNRICINLGKEERYLYFLNIPISEINLILSQNKDIDINNKNINEVVNLFLEQNSRYPILRLKINPMEGYIAPTENIIHDGSTDGTNCKDITLTIRGYFS